MSSAISSIQIWFLRECDPQIQITAVLSRLKPILRLIQPEVLTVRSCIVRFFSICLIVYCKITLNLSNSTIQHVLWSVINNIDATLYPTTQPSPGVYYISPKGRLETEKVSDIDATLEIHNFTEFSMNNLFFLFYVSILSCFYRIIQLERHVISAVPNHSICHQSTWKDAWAVFAWALHRIAAAVKGIHIRWVSHYLIRVFRCFISCINVAIDSVLIFLTVFAARIFWKFSTSLSHQEILSSHLWKIGTDGSLLNIATANSTIVSYLFA